MRTKGAFCVVPINDGFREPGVGLQARFGSVRKQVRLCSQTFEGRFGLSS